MWVNCILTYFLLNATWHGNKQLNWSPSLHMSRLAAGPLCHHWSHQVVSFRRWHARVWPWVWAVNWSASMFFKDREIHLLGHGHLGHIPDRSGPWGHRFTEWPLPFLWVWRMSFRTSYKLCCQDKSKVRIYRRTLFPWSFLVVAGSWSVCSLSRILSAVGSHFIPSSTWKKHETQDIFKSLCYSVSYVQHH